MRTWRAPKTASYAPCIALTFVKWMRDKNTGPVHGTGFLAPVFSQIPTAAIAGVLIGTSFRIFNKATMLEIFTSTKANIVIFLVTVAMTLGVDLIWGIISGVVTYFAAKWLHNLRS